MGRRGEVNAYDNYAFPFLISLSTFVYDSELLLAGDLIKQKKNSMTVILL